MNADFFALAFLAAVNPKLLALDLLLIENRRPRAMFLYLLLGALLVGVTIGLLDVLVFHLDAITHQRSVVAVFVFVLISLLLIIIPFAFLELRPEATKARLKRSQAWLMRHAQQLIVAVALLLGAYLTVSGLVRLS
jgi:Sap, sulfolipid-1-addressing protein